MDEKALIDFAPLSREHVNLRLLADQQSHRPTLDQRFRSSNHIRRPYRACGSRCERRGFR
jgi:hypothetical protein